MTGGAAVSTTEEERRVTIRKRGEVGRGLIQLLGRSAAPQPLFILFLIFCPFYFLFLIGTFANKP
jgi:hypothetical protein